MWPGSGTCSDKNQWCYEFLDFEIIEKDQYPQSGIEVILEFTAASTENVGQVDVVMTTRAQFSEIYTS